MSRFSFSQELGNHRIEFRGNYHLALLEKKLSTQV